MSPIDEYLDSVTSAQREELQRIRLIVHSAAPSAVEGVSYSMPAYLYRGKGLLSAMANKKFLSLYPFSGKVIHKLREQLTGFELTTGSIHYSLEHPVPESILWELIMIRCLEIESKSAPG